MGIKHLLLKFVKNIIEQQKYSALYNSSKYDVSRYAHVVDPENVFTQNGKINIGPNTIINKGCSIASYDATITIEKDVMIGNNTVINTIDHIHKRTDIPMRLQGMKEKNITIHKGVWIGANCTILKGVTIGEHTIIGAHSLVTHNIPPYTIAYGVPAKVQKHRK